MEKIKDTDQVAHYYETLCYCNVNKISIFIIS